MLYMTMEELDQGLSPSFNKASRDLHVSDGIQTPAACVAGGHSTKELSRHLNNLSILSRYKTELKRTVSRKCMAL
jgi:hypothetical protein